MTFQEALASNKAFLNAAEAATLIGCDPQYIRIAARECPERLGYPVSVINNRVKIPRIPFLNFWGYVTKHEEK